MLEKYDNFWTDMDEIDANIQVLDPFHPTRADTHRRIIIGSKVILHVDVNPLTPRSLPHVRFLGSDEAAYAFDKEFTKNCKVRGSAVHECRWLLIGNLCFLICSFRNGMPISLYLRISKR